jgi:hypothetical protein
MDLSDRALSAIQNVWCRIDNPLPYGKGRASLRSAVTLPNATIPLSDAVSLGLDSSGQIRIRDQIVTYTGKDNGTHDLTGASGGVGTFAAGTIITQVGDNVGGWGIDCAPLDRVGEMWNEGYRLQEQVNAWLNGGRDMVSMSVAPYYFNSDLNEDWTLAPAWQAGAPSGGLGLGRILTGPADPKLPSGVANTNANRTAERDFEFTTSGGWQPWSTTAPGKRVLSAVLYGKMDSGTAEDNGEVYGYTLKLRWVLDPE